jgi:hypothetical protein
MNVQDNRFLPCNDAFVDQLLAEVFLNCKICAYVHWTGFLCPFSKKVMCRLSVVGDNANFYNVMMLMIVAVSR